MKRYGFINAKTLFFFSVLVSAALFAVSCSEPIYTQVSYNVNNYQDGKTIGKGKFNSNLGAQRAPSFLTELNLSEKYDSNKVNIDPYSFSPDYLKSAFVVSYSGTYGISREFDMNLDLSVGFNEGGAAPGIKLYGKYRLTPRNVPFNISLMPGVSYTSGTVSKKNGNTLESNLIGLELLLPMSYDFTDDISLNFGLKSYYFKYLVPGSYSWRENDKTINKKKQFDYDFFAPAFSLGFRYMWVCPEITIIRLDNKFAPFYGIGLKLNDIHF